MRVLVTGGTGFLGRCVVAALLERGHEVRALVRSSRSGASLPKGVEEVSGDLRLRHTLPDAVRGVDAVVHLAACVVGDDEAQFASTVVGSENLLDAMAAEGVSRLVHCSSFSVYDWSHAPRMFDESAPLERNLYQRDGYAIAKAWQERLVRRYAEKHGWQLTVLRPGFIWGAGNEQIAAIGHSFGTFHVVFGGRRSLPITYVENCAECFALALESPAGIGATFNIVDDEQPSAWRYMGRCRRELGLGGHRLYVPYWCGLTLARLAAVASRTIFHGKGKLPGLLVPCRYQARFRPALFSNAKVKSALGWKPRWSFDEAWRRTRRVKGSNATATSTMAAVVAQETPCEV